ncbi:MULTISPECIES: YheT family hydrolase [Cyanophyceae]|nr:alpha/beta fold hydrolase [Coleofasciculus sp. FACHB-125]MBD1899285.1 alpha/beta fold hydrolase [Coleofasciculus sp. FACHB-125]
MPNLSYTPPWLLRNGLSMTLYTALQAGREWEKTTVDPEPSYQETTFTGAGDVPIYGWVAIPDRPHGTIVGTYGITGDLENQWFLRLLGRKAFAQGYAVVLFDWRAHGKTAQLSPTLTSDGLYEGEDFVYIAAQAKAMGCPAPFWFTGYSLGGQLALWAVKASQELLTGRSQELELQEREIGGAAVICPSLDSNRSLSYLVKHPLGKYLEQAIARELKRLAWRVHHVHPEAIDPAAIERANSIWGFDNELVIGRLGFPSVEAYYDASSALHLLPHLKKPTLILYAADDPMFDPSIVPELQASSDRNPDITLVLTQYGGHVGYISSQECQRQTGDPDPWWAWNRILEWCKEIKN